MSCGAVPIVSNLECFQDYIDPFKNGVIFNHKSSDPVLEIAQAIISLTNCPERLSTMATSSRLSTIRHYPSNVALEFLQCFDQMLNQSLFL